VIPVELTNWTVWGKSWFEDGWEGLRRFCQAHGIAGLELLASGVSEDTSPPGELVRGVHLRSIGNWLPLKGVNLREFGHGAERYANLDGYETLVGLRAEELRQLARLEPDYAIWHANFAPFPEVFTGTPVLSGPEFLGLLAQLVIDVLSEYNPPFSVCFENCFGVGLNFDEIDTAKAFLDAMEGLPVGLCLDTGHYLNAHRELANPQVACERLLHVAEGLRGQGVPVQVVHLHWTDPERVPADIWQTAGSLVRDAVPSPEFARQVSGFFLQCDQHRPLCHPLVGQLLDRLGPNYVVHEMGAMSLQDHSAWLSAQAGALRGG